MAIFLCFHWAYFLEAFCSSFFFVVQLAHNPKKLLCQPTSHSIALVFSSRRNAVYRRPSHNSRRPKLNRNFWIFAQFAEGYKLFTASASAAATKRLALPSFYCISFNRFYVRCFLVFQIFAVDFCTAFCWSWLSAFYCVRFFRIFIRFIYLVL